MCLSEDTYNTIAAPSPEVLFKDRKSKFYGYAFPLVHEDEVKSILGILRKKHPSANHFCYAWQIGIDTVSYRANDDGEPKNSAGMPIYRQLQSFGVTNALVMVARVFGGTKLGVGGLINAYRNTAQLTLEKSIITKGTVEIKFVLEFDYDLINEVMRMVKRLQLNIISQEMQSSCTMIIAIARKKSAAVLKEMKAIHRLKITPI